MSNSSFAQMKKKLAQYSQQQAAPTPTPSKHSDTARKAKLKSILKDLKAGKHVQNRTLKTWLTADEDAFRKLARAIMVSLSEKSDMAAFSEMPALNP